MEFREFYRGVCAKIRFDYSARSYHAVLEGLPATASIQASSYDDLQRAFRQTVDDELSHASGNDELFPGINQIDEIEITGDDSPDEEVKDDPYSHRKFLR